MRERRVRDALLLLSVSMVVVLAIFMLRKPEPLQETALTGITAQFMECLPDELTDPQRAEIRGLLRRFQSKAQAGLLRAEDQAEVMGLLEQTVARGSIERGELNTLMAKVGYYAFRAQSGDSLDIHPLLDPIEEPGDSLR